MDFENFDVPTSAKERGYELLQMALHLSHATEADIVIGETGEKGWN